MEHFTNQALSKQQMTFIFETYKVNHNMEDNPSQLGERVVSMKDLVSTRIKRKNKRINDVLAIH